MMTTQNPDNLSSNKNEPIGFISGGGLEANLQVRLTVPAQSVQSGAFVVMDSGYWRFYGLVTDLQLCATDPQYANQLNIHRFDPALASILNKQTLFTNLAVMPALMLEIGPEPGAPEYSQWRGALSKEPTPMPVKTVPDHHTPVRLADKGDIEDIFGKESKTVFRVGETREQGHAVCLDLEKFVQRSSGIFGTTGSGKSFLARMILAGLIHADKASTLIFDMHNEYGIDSTSSDTGAAVPGLKGKFSSKVRLVGLGADSSFHGRQPDFTLEIAHNDITPDDILLLAKTLNLTDASGILLDALQSRYRENWFSTFMDMKSGEGAVYTDEDGKQRPTEDSVAAWANEVGAHVGSAEALHRKLRALLNRGYLVKEPASKALDQIINNLQEGRHVVLSFGNYEKDIDYLLVTNLITRKIREAWEKATADFHSKKGNEPRPLVVVVEEAHKLLNREMASQTIFSTIAREMRKYYVTLLIIDQRPSQIYDEVMSQLGTRIAASLGDEDDINAVLSGLPGRGGLRGMLAKLQPKEEVLMLGWGVPMPIPIRSRRYDQVFWDELLGDSNKAKTKEDALRMMGF
ncbi:MAG TPA: ATP-binding protein [Anaerolineaceae bacterium]|nr:ATP-binding protein [Anaerolineaceae bacterium]